jgi:hypothetical protein
MMNDMGDRRAACEKSTGRERYGHAFGEFGKAKAQLKHEAGAIGVVFYGRSRRNGSTRSRKKSTGQG